MFRNIQDQFLHAMESDTMDLRAMKGDVHLPEGETKCKRKFTQMSISVAGYPNMELVSYPVSDDLIEDTEKETCSKYYRLCMIALGLNTGGQGRDVNGNLHVYMVEANLKKHPANLDFVEAQEAKLMALQKVEDFKHALSEKISEKLVPTIVDMEPYLPTDFSEKQDLWNHWMAQQASTREKNEKERLARQIRDREDDEELQLVLED